MEVIDSGSSEKNIETKVYQPGILSLMNNFSMNYLPDGFSGLVTLGRLQGRKMWAINPEERIITPRRLQHIVATTSVARLIEDADSAFPDEEIIKVRVAGQEFFVITKMEALNEIVRHENIAKGKEFSAASRIASGYPMADTSSESSELSDPQPPADPVTVPDGRQYNILDQGVKDAVSADRIKKRANTITDILDHIYNEQGPVREVNNAMLYEVVFAATLKDVVPGFPFKDEAWDNAARAANNYSDLIAGVSNVLLTSFPLNDERRENILRSKRVEKLSVEFDQFFNDQVLEYYVPGDGGVFDVFVKNFGLDMFEDNLGDVIGGDRDGVKNRIHTMLSEGLVTPEQLELFKQKRDVQFDLGNFDVVSDYIFEAAGDLRASVNLWMEAAVRSTVSGFMKILLEVAKNTVILRDLQDSKNKNVTPITLAKAAISTEPPTHITFRSAEDDMTIRGHRIEKGSIIAFSIASVAKSLRADIKISDSDELVNIQVSEFFFGRGFFENEGHKLQYFNQLPHAAQYLAWMDLGDDYLRDCTGRGDALSKEITLTKYFLGNAEGVEILDDQSKMVHMATRGNTFTARILQRGQEA